MAGAAVGFGALLVGIVLLATSLVVRSQQRQERAQRQSTEKIHSGC